MLLLDNLSLLVVVVTAISLMMASGLEKHALERKSGRKMCPSCGRETSHGCRCFRR
jgi:hypothetical protein